MTICVVLAAGYDTLNSMDYVAFSEYGRGVPSGGGEVPPVEITAELDVESPADAAIGDEPMITPPEAGEARLSDLDERAHLITDTMRPLPGQEAIQEQHDRWYAGEPVQSEVTPVGIIKPTAAELAAIRSNELLGVPYQTRGSAYPLWRHTEELRESLDRIVAADMERCGLDGELVKGGKAGNYVGRTDREPPHSDNFRSPVLRWTVAVGVGATIGYSGLIPKADTHDLGHVEPGGGKGLREVTFPDPTVTRFVGSGGIHAGPFGNGGRILLISTLLLPHR